MIFATVGTNEAPFDRLIGGLPVGGPEPVVIQHGPSTLRPAGATCVDYLSFEQMLANIRAARVVVTHAGVGSIMACLSQSKVPVVMARQHAHGEAVDDHQVPLAERMAAAGLVRVAADVRELATLIQMTDHAPPALRPDGGALAADVRAVLGDLIG